MKYIKAKPIEDLVSEYLRFSGLETPLLEHRLMDKAWPAVVGKDVEACTRSLKIFNQVLYVKVDSAVVRQELLMQRTSLVHRLNAYVDAYVISDIRFS